MICFCSTLAVSEPILLKRSEGRRHLDTADVHTLSTICPPVFETRRLDCSITVDTYILQTGRTSFLALQALTLH